MISDAYVRFTCDLCGEDEEVTPEVHYRDYSGKTPMIDLRDESLEESMPRGWKIIDGKHVCDGCVEAKEDAEEEAAAKEQSA